MKFSKCICLAVMAIFFIFAQRSEGKMSPDLSETVETEDDEEPIIKAGVDKDSLAARATIEAILKEVQKSPLYGASPLAINTAIDGILSAVRITYAFVRQAYKAIDMASNLVKAQDTEGTIDAINNGLKSDRKMIFTTGVPIHYAQGCALALVGGLALSGLQNASISIQTAGSEAFEVIEVALELATAGIKAGGRAAEEAFKAAKYIISAGSTSMYKNIKKTTKYILGGIQYAASKATNEVDIVPGIIESLKTQISTNNSAALDAISRLDDGLKLASNDLSKETSLGASKVMFEGLRSTILEIADAMSVAKKALKEAGKKANLNTESEAEVAAVRKGIKQAQDKIFSASALGFLALGAAGKIVGKVATQGLVPAFIKTEHGRSALYEDFGLIERTAIVGIRGGEIADGINAALQACNAAEIALYQQFVDAAEIGFEVFRKV